MQFCFRCFVFSDFSDSQYSVFKVQSGFSSVSKISSSKWVRQPPILPYRLQYSTFGRYGLHRRVRDGNGCYPIPYRHRKYLVVLLFIRSCRKHTRTPTVSLCVSLRELLRSPLGARSRFLYQSFYFSILACKHAVLRNKNPAALTLTTGQ